MPLSFHSADITFQPKQKQLLRSFILASFEKEAKKKLRLTYIFCSDEFLLDINQRFLQHNTYTDIITFPLAETEKLTEAEIYISIERVKENAARLKVGFEEELQRVMFHGVLHLCGFRDKTKAEQQVMREKEEEWLKKFPRFAV